MLIETQVLILWPYVSPSTFSGELILSQNLIDDLLVIIQIRSPCTFPSQTWNAQQVPIIYLHYYSPKHQKAPDWNSSSSPQNSLVFPDGPFQH